MDYSITFQSRICKAQARSRLSINESLALVQQYRCTAAGGERWDISCEVLACPSYQQIYQTPRLKAEGPFSFDHTEYFLLGATTKMGFRVFTSDPDLSLDAHQIDALARQFQTHCATQVVKLTRSPAPTPALGGQPVDCEMARAHTDTHLSIYLPI